MRRICHTDSMPVKVPQCTAIWTDGKSLDQFDQDFVEFFCLVMENLEVQGWEAYGVVNPPNTTELEAMLPGKSRATCARVQNTGSYREVFVHRPRSAPRAFLGVACP
jgi:hypothetical protein